jgi:hypothetical protein
MGSVIFDHPYNADSARSIAGEIDQQTARILSNSVAAYIRLLPVSVSEPGGAGLSCHLALEPSSARNCDVIIIIIIVVVVVVSTPPGGRGADELCCG